MLRESMRKYYNVRGNATTDCGRRWLNVVFLLALIGTEGCTTHSRYRYSMPRSTEVHTVDHRRPALVTPTATSSVSTASEAASVKAVVQPVAKPAPLLHTMAPVTAARTNSTAASTASSSIAYRLKAGDPIVVYLRGIPGVAGGEQQMEDIIDENGFINLPYVGAIQAGGKTSTELEQTIQKTYVDQQIYKYITVNVVTPSKSYYVRGEIKQPGRFSLLGRVTVIQAIAASGGFTEFANPSKVEILRGNKRIRINVAELEKYPERDKELVAGDVIIVQRSFF